MFTIDFTKPSMYKDFVYFNQGNLSSNNILRCKVITGGDTSLEDYFGEVTFFTLSRKEINGVCKIVDDKNCIIDIHFPSNALEVGENTLEIILTKGSGSNKVVAQSPVIKYKVWQGITTGNGVQGDNNYPILIDLISSVNNVVRVANNASATANASLRQTAKMLEDVDNVLVKANNTINATNNAKNKALEAVEDVKNAIAAGTQDLEVKNARGKYSNLNERLDNLDKDLLKAKDMTVIPIVTEENFATVEDTVDGYFEDIKIEGKTLVNLGNKVLKYENIYMGVEFIRPLDPDTEYTFILSGFNSSKFTHHICTNGDGSQPIYNGSTDKIVNFTTPANLTNNNRMIYIYPKQGYTITQDDINNLKPIILEGNFTQNPPGYFEGIASVNDGVDEIVVSSCNGVNLSTKLTRGSLVSSDGEEIEALNRSRTDYMLCIPNKKIEWVIDESLIGRNHFYDKNKKWIGTTDNLKVFTTPVNCYYLRTVFLKSPSELPEISIVDNKIDKKKVLYYDTETQTWKKPILSEWDTIEKHNDGKYYYHKRSVEDTLNGNHDENYVLYGNVTNVRQGFVSSFTLSSKYPSATEIKGLIISDKFKTISHNDVYYDLEGEGIGITISDKIVINIDKSKANSVQTFKEWLQSNPITIVYQLAKEEVYECTPIELITFEYKTNYMIECGSITPKTTLKCVNYIGNIINTLKEKVSYLENKLYNTNLANFAVALNTLDTKLKLEQLTKTPK